MPVQVAFSGYDSSPYGLGRASPSPRAAREKPERLMAFAPQLRWCRTILARPQALPTAMDTVTIPPQFLTHIPYPASAGHIPIAY